MNQEYEVTTDSLPMIVGIEPAAEETVEKVGFKIDGIDAEALDNGTLQLNITYQEAYWLVKRLIGLTEYLSDSPIERLRAASEYWKKEAKKARKTAL